jgi:hypothetical protein
MSHVLVETQDITRIVDNIERILEHRKVPDL